jgi:hypothetical protein
MFKPGVRFTIVRSQDQKVDMFGKMDFGAGTLLFKDDEDDNEDDTYLLLDWDVALGARYWAHPQFAVSATGGLQGSYFREKDEPDPTEYSSEDSFHLMGVAGALQILGVF